MQHAVSNNDLTGPDENQVPVLDSVTSKFLSKAFKVLRPRDAIAITGSCVVAKTLQQEGAPSFLPGDIDVFVKENLNFEHDVFDRLFLLNYILLPLKKTQGINWQPKEIPIRQGVSSVFQKYANCKINILHIIEICLFQKGEKDVNRPKIQIIIVADDSPILLEDLPVSSLSPFERKIVTSFDIDIVQGAYNPNRKSIVFADASCKQNILRRQFWYMWDPTRFMDLHSAFTRITKYTDRTFIWLGFKDVMNPDRMLSFPRYNVMEPHPDEQDIDPAL